MFAAWFVACLMPCFPTLDFSPFLVLLFLRRHPGAGFMYEARTCSRSFVFFCLVCVVFWVLGVWVLGQGYSALHAQVPSLCFVEFETQ